MIKRTIELSWKCTHLKTRERQLVFLSEGKELGEAPSEDVGLLILDSPRLTCTQRALAEVAGRGGVVVLCGDDHLPLGLLLPFAGNELLALRLRQQIAAKAPICKNLWRQIVQAKLRAQGSLLAEKTAARARLAALANAVKSGDPMNCEAQGARYYWPALLGPKFRRNRDGEPPNNFLNFGYMALRAAMARAVVGAGLHPAIGLHHHNRANAFALADDLLEPYRPFVDARVLTLWWRGEKEMTPDNKRQLLEVMTDPVQLEDGQGPLFVAMGKTASSLAACLAGERKKLDLPRK